MNDLKAQAEALGIEVDGRWSDETIQQKITEARPEQGEPREKTLHELNMEARAIDRELRGLNTAAGEAAKQAVVQVLSEKRPDGKRTLKNQRPV